MPLLIEKLSTTRNLKAAWYSLKKNPDSQGIDGISIKAFEANLSGNIKQIQKEIKGGTYKFVPPKGRLIDKDEGKKRPLKIPAVKDRVVQRAIRNVIDQRFKKFHYPCSYGYIEKRKREDAASKIAWLRDRKHWYVLEADIKSFFDCVDQKRLLDIILPELPDESITWLIKDALDTTIGNKANFSEEDLLKYFPDGTVGISQGGVLSPLFANIYLSSFDKYMLGLGYKLIRYADDFIVMCKTETEARQAHDHAKEFLKKNLGLDMHDDVKKTQVTHFGKGFNFLGYAFNYKKILPSQKAVKKFREKITEMTHKNNFIDLITMGVKLRNIIHGWANAYRFCHQQNIKYGHKDFLDVLSSLDSHIKERVGLVFESCELQPKEGALRGFHFMKYGIPSTRIIIERKSA
jgi:RNA-directed DNA polymerase